MRIARAALPRRARRASRCRPPARAGRPRCVTLVVVAEADEHLVEHDVVEDLDALGSAPSSSAKRAGVVAAALDELGDRPCGRASAARRRREAARAARELRVSSPPGRARRRARPAQVAGARRDIAARCASGCAQNAIPESYGTFSHLCASVAHESARSTPATRWRKRGLARGPEPERAVDVQPGAGALRRVGDLVERVERAGVDVARPARRRSSARRRRSARRASASARIRPCSSAATRSICAVPMPEEAQRAVDRDVPLARRRGRGAAARPGGRRVRVPAGRREHVVPRGGERGHVRHLAAGDEAGRDAVGQAEQLGEPRERDLLDDRGARPADEEAGVLIPGRRRASRRRARRAARRR